MYARLLLPLAVALAVVIDCDALTCYECFGEGCMAGSCVGDHCVKEELVLEGTDSYQYYCGSNVAGVAPNMTCKDVNTDETKWPGKRSRCLCNTDKCNAAGKLHVAPAIAAALCTALAALFIKQ